MIGFSDSPKKNSGVSGKGDNFFQPSNDVSEIFRSSSLTRQHGAQGFKTAQGSLYKFADDGSNRIQRKKTIVNDAQYNHTNPGEVELKEPSDISYFIDPDSVAYKILSQYMSIDPISGKSMTSAFDYLFYVVRGDEYIPIDQSNLPSLSINDQVVFLRMRKGINLRDTAGGNKITTKEVGTLNSKQRLALKNHRSSIAKAYGDAAGKNIVNSALVVAIAEDGIGFRPDVGSCPFDINFEKKSIHLGNKIVETYDRIYSGK